MSFVGSGRSGRSGSAGGSVGAAAVGGLVSSVWGVIKPG